MASGVKLGPLVDIFTRFAADHGVVTPSNVREAEQRAFADESRRLEGELKRTTAARATTETTAAASIPPFYLERTNPQSAAVRHALQDAARSREIAVRFEILDYWDGAALTYLQDKLTSPIDVPGGKVPFPVFNRIAKQMEKWREEKGKTLKPELRKLAADFGFRIPEFDVNVFLACAQDATGCVEGMALLKVLAKQASLFKTESELMIIDADNTGCVTEEELEGYIGDLIESVPTLAKIDREFYPFYTCGALRHIMWVHDPTGRGRVKIADLVAGGIMDEWLDVQLSPVEIPRNWFSASIATQLYEKFLSLDRRGDGMLVVDDLKRYKQGIPSVIEDGLPRDVSPFSELFLERVFETTKMYNGEMDYKKFVDFVVAVEFLPQCHRPMFFWNIFDLHNEGFVTPVIINYFFRETHAKLVAAGVNPPPMELIVPELFDVVKTSQPLILTKEEFLASPQNGTLANLIINCLSFWTYELRENK